MPLTPQSRIYEEKLANRRKKQQMRDDISKSRFQGNSKPVESFSSPVSERPTLNANLRGANFMRGGLAVQGAKTLLDWDTLKSAAEDPMSTAKGFGKVALLSMGPGTAAGILGPKEALAAMLMQDSDVQKASAITALVPTGKGAQLVVKGTEKLAPKALNVLTGAGQKLGPSGFNAASLGIKQVPQAITAQRKVTGQTGVVLDKALETAQDRLKNNEWDIGTTDEFDTVVAAVDKINWGPYQRPVSKKVAGKEDITKINLEDMTSEESKYFSPEEMQILENLDTVKSIDRQTDAAWRGSAEPIRIRVQKYPTWEEFRSRLTGERLGGIPVEQKRELYKETLKLIDDTDGYWSVKRLELGKKPISIGGMDMAHLQHFKLGGKGVTKEGEINVVGQSSGLNRAQQAEGYGGHEGFKNWWDANQNIASNRAIIEALYFDRF